MARLIGTILLGVLGWFSLAWGQGAIFLAMQLPLIWAVPLVISGGGFVLVAMFLWLIGLMNLFVKS